MSFITRLKQMMLTPGATEEIDGDYYDDEYDDMLQDAEGEHVEMIANRDRHRRISNLRTEGDKVIPFQSGSSNKPAETIIFHPSSIQEAAEICGHIRTGRMVIIDISQINKGEAQRIADYLSGVCHSLDGKTERISDSIFLVAPRNHYVMNDNKVLASRDLTGTDR